MKRLIGRRWMGTNRRSYETPLTGRYTSQEMAYNWSEEKKFVTFRRLWLALAQGQHELGLEQVKKEHLDEMRRNLTNINYDVAEAKERCEQRRSSLAFFLLLSLCLFVNARSFKGRFDTMSCLIYLLLGSNVHRLLQLFIWELPRAMWGIIPISFLFVMAWI